MAPSHPITSSISVPSVDLNRGSSLLDKGVHTGASMPMEPAASCSACQVAQSSGQVMNTQIGSVLVTSILTTAQAEEIFLLSHEVQTLHRKLALDFIELSHSEASFRMGAQATGHENTVEEHPDCSSGKCSEASQRLGETTWLHINSSLFCHTLDYQRYMVQLVNCSQEAIQALHECIWEVVRRVMESAGKSMADGLGVALHLVGMLPTIPLQLTFNTVTAGPLGHTPEALTYASQRSIDRGEMAVLSEELTREQPSAKDKVMQAIWSVTVTDTGSIKIMTVGGTGDDNVDHPSTSLSPAPHTSTSTDWCTTGYGAKCSPTYSPNHSPFQTHGSPGSRRRSNSSNSSVPSFDSSIPSESKSDTESSSGDSDSREQSHPSSNDVIFIGNTEDDGSEEETISLPGFLKSNTEEVRAAVARDKAHLGDVLYAAWHDNQIHKGSDEIRQCDSRVCDHPQFGKHCEAPNQVRPPFSYMEEHRVFKPTEFINNPMGLCQFYCMSPKKANVLVGPKLAKSAHRICCLR